MLPVLMYRCENWILSRSDVELLEAFQGKMTKRILKLSKHCHSHSFGLALNEGRITGEEEFLFEKSS